MKNAIDIVRGLLCLTDPDKSGQRCWNCAYKCSDEKKCRKDILRDATNFVRFADEPLRMKQKAGKK